jgi:site-specific recombinase XerD
MLSLKEQMIMDLELKGYNLKTQITYLRYMKDFTHHLGKSPEKMDEKEIKEYLHFLITQKKASQSTISCAYSALKFFYETTLHQDWGILKIPRIKTNRQLPIVLARSEVKDLLEVTTNLKHRAILMTTYAAGLRVSETAHLKINDIDSKRMQIRVEQGKGKKDRYTLLSEINLNLLRSYWKIYQPKTWLFPGNPPENPISTRSIQHI